MGNGWGGRIRTCECRYQKPVPYRLATPQQGRPVERALVVRARLIVAMPRLKSAESGGATMPVRYFDVDLVDHDGTPEIKSLELCAAELPHDLDQLDPNLDLK